MEYRKLPLHSLLPKHGMRYRSGRSILRCRRHDAQVYRAWSKTAGSTKIFKDLKQGSRVIDLVLANMLQVARQPSVSKHLKSSLTGGGLSDFARAIKREIKWARKLSTGVFMEFLYQLIHAHKVSALEENGNGDGGGDGTNDEANNDYSRTVQEISAFLAEHRRDWSIAAQERDNYLLTEAHLMRRDNKKNNSLQERFDDGLCDNVSQGITPKGSKTISLDG